MGRTYDYGRPRRTAVNLVTRFGVAAQLRQGSNKYDTVAAFTDYKSRDVDGTKIQAGDFIALVPAQGIPVPKKDDALYWQSRERTIVSVKLTKPGPVEVLYELQMRGPR